MKKTIATTIIFTNICTIWLVYLFSIMSKSNAPVCHIISAPLGNLGLFPLLIILTITLLIAECSIIFKHKSLFRLLFLGFTVLLISFLFPSIYLRLKIQNKTNQPLRIQSTNVSSDITLSRGLGPQKTGYIILDEGESRELFEKKVFILTVYDSQGNILYSKRMTGKDIYTLKTLTIKTSE